MGGGSAGAGAGVGACDGGDVDSDRRSCCHATIAAMAMAPKISAAAATRWRSDPDSLGRNAPLLPFLFVTLLSGPDPVAAL